MEWKNPTKKHIIPVFKWFIRMVNFGRLLFSRLIFNCIFKLWTARNKFRPDKYLGKRLFYVFFAPFLANVKFTINASSHKNWFQWFLFNFQLFKTNPSEFWKKTTHTFPSCRTLLFFFSFFLAHRKTNNIFIWMQFDSKKMFILCIRMNTNGKKCVWMAKIIFPGKFIKLHAVELAKSMFSR